MPDKIRIRFSADIPGERSLAWLDQLAKGGGNVMAKDVRELARITAMVAREANALAHVLQQIAAAGDIQVG